MDEVFDLLFQGQKMRVQDYQKGFQQGVERAAKEFAYYYAGKYTEEELARRLCQLTYENTPRTKED